MKVIVNLLIVLLLVLGACDKEEQSIEPIHYVYITKTIEKDVSLPDSIARKERKLIQNAYETQLSRLNMLQKGSVKLADYPIEHILFACQIAEEHIRLQGYRFQAVHQYTVYKNDVQIYTHRFERSYY